MIKILFVCLGNICRSPAAEAIMNKKILEQNLENYISCNSAGTSNYHIGDSPDYRMKEAISKRGYVMNSKGKQIKTRDIKHFDYLIAMDLANYQDILSLDKDKLFNKKIYQLKDFSSDPKVEEVPDPYYGGEEGFNTVLNILEDACQNLLEHIKKEKPINE